MDCFRDNNYCANLEAGTLEGGSITTAGDHASKNHTYVNSQMIPAQTEIEIHDGDHIRLGNEEFVFNVWC